MEHEVLFTKTVNDAASFVHSVFPDIWHNDLRVQRNSRKVQNCLESSSLHYCQLSFRKGSLGLLANMLKAKCILNHTHVIAHDKTH